MNPAPVSLRAVVFDCDGVLFDSLSANTAFYNAILAALGLPAMSPLEEALSHRMATRQFFESCFPDDPALVARARAVAQEMDYGPFYGQMRPVEGLHEVLEGLRGRYRLAMATNRGQTAHEVVDRFGLRPWLEFTIGHHEVPRPKPWPDMLERCLEHFGLAPEEALYVGDAISDREAAEAAGLYFVGVGNTTGGARRIDALRALPAFLAEHFENA